MVAKTHHADDSLIGPCVPRGPIGTCNLKINDPNDFNHITLSFLQEINMGAKVFAHDLVLFTIMDEGICV